MKIDLRKCWNPKSLFNKTEKPVPRPAGREQVIDWYKSTQKPKKIGFNAEGNVHEWFHGKYVDQWWTWWEWKVEKREKGQMAGEMLIRIYVQTRLGPILSPCVCVCDNWQQLF